MPLDGIQSRTSVKSLFPVRLEDINIPKANKESLSRAFSLFAKPRHTSLHPFINFRGQMSVDEVLFSVQNFSLKQKDKFVFIENFPTNSFPKIEIILEEKNSTYKVTDFKIRPSDSSVQREILYTRFFLTTVNARKCSLHFRDMDFPPFNFGFSELPSEEKRRTVFRAKLFRKLGFIEKNFEKTKFNVPENIAANDVRQIEVLFRAITEGEFSIPAGNSITVFNYRLGKGDLQNLSNSRKKEFFFEFNEDLRVLDKFFQTGKMAFKIRKGAIANPRVIRGFKENEIIESLQLNVFDHQIHHYFEKYSNAERLLKNKQKLEQFKNALRKEEPEFLVKLLDEPLAEIDEKSALEIVEGLLQYHDFPDRFSVLKAKLERNRWKVPIALTYPKREAILLTNAFVDVGTGKVEMKISFDELLRKGKRKAKEVFSIA